MQVLWESKVAIRRWGEIEKKERKRLGLCWVDKGPSRGVSGSANDISLESRLGRRFSR